MQVRDQGGQCVAVSSGGIERGMDGLGIDARRLPGLLVRLRADGVDTVCPHLGDVFDGSHGYFHLCGKVTPLKGPASSTPASAKILATACDVTP